MTQRLGSKSRALMYEESTPEQDPGAPVGYVLDTSARTDFAISRERIMAEIYRGNRQPFGSILGMVRAQGGIPQGLEYRTVGRVMKVMQGGTSGAPVATGGGYLHYIPLSSTLIPGTMQVQYEWLETPAIYARAKAVKVNAMRFAFQPAGVCTYALDLMATGKDAYTDLAGTKNEEAYVGQSYFNGFLELNAVSQAGVTNFSLALSNDLSREDVCFRNGLAGAINPGIAGAVGDLEMMFEDLNYLNQAIANSPLPLEMMWANAPMASATQFLYIVLPQTVFDQGPLGVGGREGLRLPQAYRAEFPDSSASGANALPAFAFSNKETFNIGASSFQLGIKIDGGGTITKVLTQGATRTAAQVVADIGAVTGGSADVWPKDALGAGGRVRIRTNTKGVGGSVQIDTGVANSAHTALGFDGTVRTGKAPSAYHAFLFNDISTAL